MPKPRVIMQALEILKHGAVQPTGTFGHLIPWKAEENPWAHQQRVLLMLKNLAQHLDEVDSQWILVRLSKRGQAGLYQLQKRHPDAGHVSTSSQT